MKIVLYVSLTTIIILSAIGAYYKRLYDKEVALHTSTKEALVERSRALQDVSKSLDICMFEATLSNTAIINICENNNKVGSVVDDIKQFITESSKKTVERVEEGGENVKTIYNVVDTINPDIDRLLSEGWDRIYNKD